ncbi:hypothetical protein MPTK2_1g09650 [Marchantia polymorpha subsp. ruderalis]
MEFPMKGVEHKYIVTEVGNRVHCVVAGAGPPVLLLHGFPEFWYSFRYQIPALAAAGFRVIVPDTRGAGESEIVEASDKYMWNDIIGDTVAVLKGLNVTEKVLVVGHDWGAMFAGQLSRIRPDLVRAVVYLGFIPFTWRAQLTLVEDMRLVFGDEVYIHVFQVSLPLSHSVCQGEDIFFDVGFSQSVERRSPTPYSKGFLRQRRSPTRLDHICRSPILCRYF